MQFPIYINCILWCVLFAITPKLDHGFKLHSVQVQVYERFGGTYYLGLQDRILSQANSKRSVLCLLLFTSPIFSVFWSMTSRSLVEAYRRFRGTHCWGTKWLHWRHHKESPTLHQNYRTDRGINRKGKHNRSCKSQGKGRINLGPPLTYIRIYNSLPLSSGLKTEASTR
jgi:hypothetical protein